MCECLTLGSMTVGVSSFNVLCVRFPLCPIKYGTPKLWYFDHPRSLWPVGHGLEAYHNVLGCIIVVYVCVDSVLVFVLEKWVVRGIWYCG